MILSSERATLNYDFTAWIAQGDLLDPHAYRLEAPSEMEFRLDEEASRELESALAVWTTHIKALSKLVTRIKVDWQVRECVPVGARRAYQRREEPLAVSAAS